MENTTNETTEQTVTVRQSELSEMIARLVQAEILLELRDSTIKQLKEQLVKAYAS